ncbi:MAG: signal peptidase I, partial [Gammaproteobacteria bacterium]|nr:signal peptidase I [Gammaproteobacteria bacterium]
HPSRGDFVTSHHAADGRLFIKRVVAVPGDRVEWNRNRLTINGEAANYAPLQAGEIGALPIDDTTRHRFYRESLPGTSRVVMLDGRPGARDPHEVVLSRLLGPPRGNCERYLGRAAGSAPLANAICRCADLGACSTFPAFTVPEGKYWMMGDNRDNSSDSRVIGFVDRRSIYGRAHAVAFSVDTDSYYRPRFERFFTNLQ